MRILLIGAYGQFGRRIASELVRNASIELTVAGRSAQAAAKFASELRTQCSDAQVTPSTLDVESPNLPADLANLSPDVVIHAAGPFQQRDYRVAEASLACDAHYIDLADGRAFVVGIDRLDTAARDRQRWVISGASSVPGLSATVVEAHRGEFAELHSVESAISPGNRAARGPRNHAGDPRLRRAAVSCPDRWTLADRARLAVTAANARARSRAALGGAV